MLLLYLLRGSGLLNRELTISVKLVSSWGLPVNGFRAVARVHLNSDSLSLELALGQRGCFELGRTSSYLANKSAKAFDLLGCGPQVLFDEAPEASVVRFGRFQLGPKHS